MAPSSVSGSDPFKDPVAQGAEGSPDSVGGSTLTVGRDASLTLATDSLIVLGKLARSTAE